MAPRIAHFRELEKFDPALRAEMETALAHATLNKSLGPVADPHAMKDQPKSAILASTHLSQIPFVR
jgi:hypothetical protein